MKFVLDNVTLLLKATDLHVTVNPRHGRFFDKYPLFSPLGGCIPGRARLL